jgi:hypothetical protein
MGQQQLLLLVLGIVIVGLAVVVGIQAFGENQKKANQDAMVNDAIRIASDAQAWALKPTAFGGGEGDFQDGTTDLHFGTLGYTDSDTAYVNVNGKYEFSVENANEALITGTGVNDDVRKVEVRICGLDSKAIKTATGDNDAPGC